jgi:hypothetical protein
VLHDADDLHHGTERDEDEQAADVAEKAGDDTSKPKAKKPKISTIKSRQSTGKKGKSKKK